MFRPAYFLHIAALLFLIVVIKPIPVFAEAGTLTDCVIGCKPSDEACINCCKEAFGVTETVNCCGDYGSCTARCENFDGVKAVACYGQCQRALKRCHDVYTDAVMEFSCPNWVKPQNCPHDCQVWNPESQKCVGAPKDVCDEGKEDDY
ncbi:hypothetical protein [Pseudodesulfovibrio sp. zrk46]|uniref:hypothetical protein n=1 Tax=Pseudodesulfovibrio sp. zrk46 TaxID=2725288 RepID=UPI0014496C21|nr:hypothetical protein [Pseudodesulfovibrio sp. zrk46]QJB55119.1 hypothetical protein HFN16_01295 [Pseudodesulfovibrio sp. zrk46]